MLDQAIQALSAGNAVCAVAAGAPDHLSPLLDADFPLTAADGCLAPDALTNLPADVVAWAGDETTAAALRQALAARGGAIVGLVRDRISPASYCLERAICIDTTAAGGNAALLAQTA